MKFRYRIDADDVEVALEASQEGYSALIGEQRYAVTDVELVDGELRFQLDGVPQRIFWAAETGNARWIGLDGRTARVEKANSAARRAGGHGPADGQHVAPMPGQVREVLVAEGNAVEEGQTLLLLEAMKMELRIQAAQAGVVQKVNVGVGQQVDKDDVLVVLTTGEDA